MFISVYFAAANLGHVSLEKTGSQWDLPGEMKVQLKKENMQRYSLLMAPRCLSSSVVKTRLQSLKKGANEETYSGVVDCAR